MLDLDEQQERVVRAGPVDLFVAAGAGTGKTRALTARFVAAVGGEHPYTPTDPRDVLTVTYTEKTAAELIERIREGLLYEGHARAARLVGDAWISTIHGMCSRILRGHALEAGLDPRFTVLDQVESSILLEESLDETLGRMVGDGQFVAELVDSYTFRTVADGLVCVRADLAAAGVDTGAVRTVDERHVRQRMQRAAVQAREISEAFAMLRATKTTQGNAAAAAALGEALEVAAGSGNAGHALIEEAGRCRFRRASSIEGNNELVDEARSLVTEARACGAQMAVAPYESAFLRVLEQFADAYAQAKKARGALDFEDLQENVVRLFASRPDVARRYRDNFAMVMVDEFQDTNAQQMRIIEQLSASNLCTVGDENQSIYSFRHADVEIFRTRRKAVSRQEKLDVNYRTAPPLLSALNGLFAHPALLGDAYMPLRAPDRPAPRAPWPERMPRLRVCFLDTAERAEDRLAQEADVIADRVEEYLSAGMAPGDIAVLMAAVSGGRGSAVRSAISKRGIPATLTAGGTFFERPEVMEVRALLRVIDNVWDDEALLCVLAGRLTGLGPEALFLISEEARHGPASRGRESGAPPHLWSGLGAALERLSEHDRASAQRTAWAIESARSMQGVQPLGETVLGPLLDVGFDVALFADSEAGARAWSNVMRLAHMADEFEVATGKGLSGFLRHLDLREAHSVGEQEAPAEAQDEAVRIMSIHSAKGLEFPIVVVGGLTSDRKHRDVDVVRNRDEYLLGMKLRGDVDAPTIGSQAATEARDAVNKEERKRLLYVACTRAQEGLSVVGRTASDKDADESMSGALRQALGMGAEGSLREGDVRIGGGSAWVTLADPPCAESDRHHVYTEAGRKKMVPVTAERPIEQRARAFRAPSASCEPAALVPLSYTALAAYDRCPYQYYLLRVARVPAPMSTNAREALRVGDAVHQVLRRAQDSNEVEDAARGACLAAGLDGSRVQEVARAARTFLESDLAKRVRSAQSVRKEEPFLVPAGRSVLSGAIDLVAWSGPDALVVDYKTGSAPLDPAEARQRYRLQAECYALAVLAAGAARAEVVFVELDRGRSTVFEFRSEDRPALLEKIEAMAARIGKGQFAPREEYVHGLCDMCPGSEGLCPVTPSTRHASE